MGPGEVAPEPLCLYVSLRDLRPSPPGLRRRRIGDRDLPRGGRTPGARRKTRVRGTDSLVENPPFRSDPFSRIETLSLGHYSTRPGKLFCSFDYYCRGWYPGRVL